MVEDSAGMKISLMAAVDTLLLFDCLLAAAQGEGRTAAERQTCLVPSDRAEIPLMLSHAAPLFFSDNFKKEGRLLLLQLTTHLTAMGLGLQSYTLVLVFCCSLTGRQPSFSQAGTHVRMAG